MQKRTPESILRRQQVQARTGLSRSTIYDRMSKGTFPKAVSLGARSVGWFESDIDSWLESLRVCPMPTASAAASVAHGSACPW